MAGHIHGHFPPSLFQSVQLNPFYIFSFSLPCFLLFQRSVHGTQGVNGRMTYFRSEPGLENAWQKYSRQAWSKLLSMGLSRTVELEEVQKGLQAAFFEPKTLILCTAKRKRAENFVCELLHCFLFHLCFSTDGKSIL